MITVEKIRSLALALPGVYEQASYGGMPSWRTKPRGFAWVRVDPEALALWVDSLETKARLLESEPRLFFTTPHYDEHPMVLVRMDRVSVARAKALLEESWRVRGGAKQATSTSSKKPSAKKSAAKKSATNKRAAKKSVAKGSSVKAKRAVPRGS